MATSGSTDFSLTGGDMVTHAHRMLRVVKRGTSLSSEQMEVGLRGLNLLSKTLQTKLRLWKKKEFWVFLVNGQESYNLPGANGALASDISETTLDAAEASGQTVLSVTSTAGFANNDVIGIVLDNDTIHWTTISSFVVNDTVTVGDALTGAAASGNAVYAYTTAITRPLRVLSGRRKNDTTESPTLEVLARKDYQDLPNKQSSGTPTQVYYDPQLGTGVLYAWSSPGTVNDVLILDGHFPLEDFDSQGNDPDFPQEWLEYLTYKLAERLAPIYEKTFPPSAQKVLDELEELVEDYDQENDADITFSVEGYR